MTASPSHHADLHRRLLRGSSQVLAALLRFGVRLGPMMLLTVSGRKTGLPRTNPVDVFERDGRCWLVSTHGVGNSSWVSNLRAAGAGHLDGGRRHLSFTAVELSTEAAGTVLREELGPRLARPLAGFVLRRTLGLDGNASAADVARAAEDHPVFELSVTATT